MVEQARLEKVRLGNSGGLSGSGEGWVWDKDVILVFHDSVIIDEYGFLWWLSGKESSCKAEDVGLERSPGYGNGNLLQHSCLGNPIDRGAWQAAVHGVTKESDMTQQLNNNNKP